MTDQEIYEAHPEIAALNDQYVALGKRAAELDAEVAAKHSALETTEHNWALSVRNAQQKFDEAQAALNAAKVEATAAVNGAKRALQRSQQEVAEVRTKRTQVQQDHNAAIAEVQAVAAAQAKAKEVAQPTE